MHRPNVLLLGASETLESDLRTALKEACKLVVLDVAAERVADEYRRRQAGAALVVLDPAPTGTVVSISGAAHETDPFAVMSNIAAAGGNVIVVSPSKDPEHILRAMRAGAREFLLGTEGRDPPPRADTGQGPTTPASSAQLHAHRGPSGEIGFIR